MKLNKYSIIALIAICCWGFYFFYKTQIRQSEFSSQKAVVKEVKVLKPTAASKADAKFNYRGPLDDCLQNSFIYARSGQILADCTLNYVHFYPSPQFRKKKNINRDPAQLKIGSFNLFHLGDNQAPLKNLELIAQIINRWDVVGAQEFMPLPGDVAANNSQLAQLIEQSEGDSIQFPYQNWRVVAPGYLRLLEELQKIDTSWGLILQSSPAGEGTSGEMAGFFYRSSVVQLKTWDYCPSEQSMDIKKNNSAPNYGCLVQVTPDRQKLISRTAFAAYFQSGNFDFVGLTTHVRFRPADSADDLKSQLDEICIHYAGTKKCSLPKDTVGRFYEVQAVAEQIGAIKSAAKDKDIIFMGDFNLGMEAKNLPYWEAALKLTEGMVVYQTQPTTLSIPGKKLASNYDHFILNPSHTTECDVKSVRPLNIPLATVNQPDPTMKLIAQLLTSEASDNWVNKNNNNLSTLLKFQEKVDSKVRPLTEKEIDEFKHDYSEARIRMKRNVFATTLELVSDHIPIEMNCRTDLPN